MDEKKIFKSVKDLVRDECANYDRGFCLETDRRCHIIHPNYKTVHDGAIDCDYFMESVLPLDWELNDLIAYALWYDEDDPEEVQPRRCRDCGKLFIPSYQSSRQIYCEACAKEETRRNTRKRVRRFRAEKYGKQEKM